jgi:LPS sulfotransferase NodH
MSVRLLLSTQRSGSHFLKAYIESRFPSVICSGELLEEPIAFARQRPSLSTHPEFPKFWLWYELEAAARNISVAPDRKIEAFAEYLSKLSAMVTPKDLVVDIKYNSIRSLSGYWDTEFGSSDFTSFITSRQIPVLHLIRKNILRVIVSNQLARQTGIWHRMEERPPDELLPKVRLNPASVLDEIRYGQRLTQDYQNRFAGYPGYEEIAYEELVREQDFPQTGAQLRTVAHFLDKKPAGPSQAALPFKRTTPEDPSEVVENWHEIVRILRGTEHGWMAQAPLLAAA